MIFCVVALFLVWTGATGAATSQAAGDFQICCCPGSGAHPDVQVLCHVRSKTNGSG